MKTFIEPDHRDPTYYHIYEDMPGMHSLRRDRYVETIHVDELECRMLAVSFKALKSCTEWPQPIDLSVMPTELPCEEEEVGVHIHDTESAAAWEEYAQEKRQKAHNDEITERFFA